MIGTSGNDTFTGAAGTVGNADILIDQSSVDNDTANLTLNAAYTPANISKVENVNFDWNAFGTAIVTATNITDANALTFTSSKVGYLGNVQVNDAGDNTIIAGTGAKGALDVNGGKTVTVNAGQAKTVTVDAAATGAVSASVTAGAATTTIEVGSATAFATTNATGGAATTSVEVNGTAGSSDVANVTVSNDATLGFQTAAVETVNVTAADGNTLTLAAGSRLDKATISSTGSVTLVAGSADLTTHTLTNSTAGLTIDLTSAGLADLSKVSFDLLNLKNALGGNLTVASGANLNAGVDLTANEILATTGTTDVVNLNLTVDQTAIDVIDGTNDVETLNITAAAASTETDGEIDVATLTAAAVVASGASKVALGNITANSVDASAVTGDVTLVEAGGANAADITIVGSSTAKNTVTFTTDSADTSYTGGAAADVVTMAQTTGDSTVVLGNGANTYTNTTLVDGDAVVLGGTGVDTITVTATDAASATANVVIQSGAGADVVSLGLAGAAAENAAVELGDGDDKITLTADTGAGDVLSINGGDGTDTVDLNGQDITAGTTTLSFVEVLDDSDGSAIVGGSLLNGKAFTIKGDGSLTTQLDVVLGTAGAYDFSNLTLDATLADGIGGLDITGAGVDTIIGTSGSDTITAADVTGAATFTGGAGADTYALDDSTKGTGTGTTTVVIGSGDTGTTTATSDIITQFETGVDSIKLGVAGTATNFFELDADSGGTDDIATVEDAITDANAATGAGSSFDGTVQYMFVLDTDSGSEGYLIADNDLDGVADFAVELTGWTKVGDVVFGDIVA